jgi:hypothetical protein
MNKSQINYIRKEMEKIRDQVVQRYKERRQVMVLDRHDQIDKGRSWADKHPRAFTKMVLDAQKASTGPIVENILVKTPPAVKIADAYYAEVDDLNAERDACLAEMDQELQDTMDSLHLGTDEQGLEILANFRSHMENV